MADNGSPLYPSIIASDAGAPEGCMNVHDQATGATVIVPATSQGLHEAVQQLNSQRDK